MHWYIHPDLSLGLGWVSSDREPDNPASIIADIPFDADDPEQVRTVRRDLQGMLGFDDESLDRAKQVQMFERILEDTIDSFKTRVDLGLGDKAAVDKFQAILDDVRENPYI